MPLQKVGSKHMEKKFENGSENREAEQPNYHTLQVLLLLQQSKSAHFPSSSKSQSNLFFLQPIYNLILSYLYIYIYLYHECPQVNFAKTGDAKSSCWMMSVHTLFKKLGSWEMTINVVLVIDRRYSESHSTDSLSSQKLPNLVHLALQSKRIPATKTWKEIYKETGEPWEKPIGHHSLQRPQQR